MEYTENVTFWEQFRVLVAGENQNAPSETFIHSHIHELTGGRHYIYALGNGYYRTIRHQTLAPQGRLAKWLGRTLRVSHTSQHTGLRKYVREHRIQCLLAEFGTVGSELWPYCQAIGLPLIVYFRGYDISIKDILEKKRATYKSMMEYASRIFIVSPHMKELIQSWGVPINKIVLNPSYPQDVFFENEPDYTSPYFLYVGRMVDKKGPHLVLLAFAQVASVYSDARLIMVGDGPLLGACVTTAKALGLQDRVQFLGSLNHEYVIPYFSRAFCFVQHSLQALNGDMEGTPVALLEAGAAALPVVATQHAGIPYSVKHGHTGWLVPEGDIEAMANYMILLYADRLMCQQMGSAARKFIYDNYRRERHLAILRQSIEETMVDLRADSRIL